MSLTDNPKIVGLISDTHGLLRPEALQALRGVDPAAAGFGAVIYGHSHRPRVETRNGVLFVNPGSAGPRRFKLPVSVARLEVGADGLRAEIVELDVASADSR